MEGHQHLILGPSDLESEGRTEIADSDSARALFVARGEGLVGGLRLSAPPMRRRDRKRAERILAQAPPEERNALRRQLFQSIENEVASATQALELEPAQPSRVRKKDRKRKPRSDARSLRNRRFADLIDLEGESVVIDGIEELDLREPVTTRHPEKTSSNKGRELDRRPAPFRHAAAFTAWTAVGAGVLLAAVLAVPPMTGHRTMVVLSGSMEPTLQIGDVVVDQKVNVLDVKVDDIITFRDPIKKKRTVTHRVRAMKVENGSVEFTTRGDSNTTDENWKIVASGKVGRVVLRVPKVGYVLGWAWSPKARVGFVVVPMILFGILEIIAIWRTPDDDVMADKKPSTKRVSTTSRDRKKARTR